MHKEEDFMKCKWQDSIYSDGSASYVSNPTPNLDEVVTIRLRVLSEAPIHRIILRCTVNGDEHLIPMTESETTGAFTYYSCDLKISQSTINYHFYIATPKETYYYTQLELTTYPPTEEYDFRIVAGYKPPSWITSAVFYQIFPDRFCSGNPKNAVQDNEYTFDNHPTTRKEWDETPGEYVESFCLDFFGGDLEGIKQKIPYLKGLGVNAIYINPIFYAATHHRYDCLDYFMVDPHLGGDPAFADLMDALHENDMKLIVDMSVNHTGTAHKWFNKETLFFPEEVGAYHNTDAKERKYYYFDENNKYHAWAGVDTLPTLNYTSDTLRDIIYRSEDSVVKKWLKPPYNIDGWRFDVANTMARMDKLQMQHDVWPEIRQNIREVNPEAYILGEAWTDDCEFLMGNEWDSSMNYYGFARPVRQFVGELDRFLDIRKEYDFHSTKRNAKDLARMFMQKIARLPHQIASVQFNLFDSHDISRLHNNPAVPFESYRGAVMMLFTFPGTPNIYYGDEVGIDGHILSVEGCRYPMPWKEEKQNQDFYDLYRTLAHLKREQEALQNGGFKILYAQDYVISYTRFTDTKAYVVVVSQDDHPTSVQIPIGALGAQDHSTIKEIFDHPLQASMQAGLLHLQLPPLASLLLEITL